MTGIARRGICGMGGAAALVLAVGGTVRPAAAREESAGALVGDLHAAFGEHHARAVHAKGVILEGRFTPTAAARSLCDATVFGATVPITVRFSDFTGLPDIPDTAGEASPRGLAIKFHVADGSTMDVVAHSYNGFPVATADEFGALLRAIAASSPAAAKPTALDQFLAAHPVAKTFLTTQRPPPASYGTAAYYGVNAVSFIGPEGVRAVVRYRFVPLAGESSLDPTAVRAMGPNYLIDEIAARVGAAPVRFEWLAQMATPGDNADDPSIAWPESRMLIKLGTISIERMAPDQGKMDKALLFMPGILPHGIEAADPMLAVRNAAYPISFGQRQ